MPNFVDENQRGLKLLFNLKADADEFPKLHRVGPLNRKHPHRSANETKIITTAEPRGSRDQFLKFTCRGTMQKRK